MSNILTNLLNETSPSRLLRVVSYDFLALRLLCFNKPQHGRQIFILNYMWTAADFIIEGRRLCTVELQ